MVRGSPAHVTEVRAILDMQRWSQHCSGIVLKTICIHALQRVDESLTTSTSSSAFSGTGGVEVTYDCITSAMSHFYPGGQIGSSTSFMRPLLALGTKSILKQNRGC